jgi:hypothetical protein
MWGRSYIRVAAPVITAPARKSTHTCYNHQAMTSQEPAEGLEVYHMEDGLQVSPYHNFQETNFYPTPSQAAMPSPFTEAKGRVEMGGNSLKQDGVHELSSGSAPQSRGRRFWLIVSIGCLLIAAGAIGGGVGGALTAKENKDQNTTYLISNRAAK